MAPRKQRSAPEVFAETDLSTPCEIAKVAPSAPQADSSDGLSDGCNPEPVPDDSKAKECEPSSAKASKQPDQVPGEACKQRGQHELDADAISDVSTKESEGVVRSPSDEAASQKWTSVLAKKKKASARTKDCAVASTAPAAKTPKQEGGGSGVEKASTPQSAPPAPRPEHKGKGLSHFQRIEVGIEDDAEFHVVRRLIGPRGKHMQDIVTACRGAKVWICGRGSRSWEDSEGPLVICVGASTSPSFDTAVGFVQELLGRVHEEYRKFNLRR